ncbi:sensor histidine kinase YesM [Thalassobacillus devorans]|uniref:histidine kinase n=2 Tax=Thalassobacillus devorans TaxID=279813 RepID=A0ABQ1NST5_9BACI|nr:sensor histidine kinase YesM [Thalassobacillus devorans]
MNIKPFYSNFKIKDKIFSISLLILFIFGLVGMITYHFFTSLYEDRIYEESAEMLQLSSSVLDQEMNKIENMSFQIATDSIIQNYLYTINRNESSFEVYQAKTKLLQRLLGYVSSYRYIASMQVIDRYGGKYTTGYNTEIENDTEKIKKLLADTKGTNIWTSLEGENVISAARLIRRKANLDLGELGTLVITIDMEEFINRTLNFSSNKNFIITSEDEIYYQTNEGEVDLPDLSEGVNENGYMNFSLNGEDYLLTFNHSNFSQLTYYHLLPFTDITKQSQAIKLFMILAFLFLIILTVLLSRRASNNISKPLEQLSKRMKSVEQGNFEDSVPTVYYNDEIGQLHENFRLMLNKINELIKENYTKQLVIKETEYKALQAQINPHFLYNTLESVNWLAKINKQEKISVMVEALGSMMRNILSKKAPMITIEEELEIVNSYITIQQYRYDKRLKFSLTVEDDLKKSKIPKLSIQPIVENAIQHGLEEMVGECSIHVSIMAHEDDIQITVQDNGPGIEESKLEGIYKGQIRSKSSGIGLSNINERIKLMFGQQYGLTIKSRVGEGTTIYILLPIMTE